MTPGQLTALQLLAGRTLTQPEVDALTPLVAVRNDAGIAALLSVGRTRRDPATKYTSLGIAERHSSLGGLPGALASEVALQKLEGFATAVLAGADPVLKLLGAQIRRQMLHLPGGGMAIGSPALGAMLSIVVQAGAMTQAEANALQDVAAVPDPISVNDISNALNALGA
jgi:hypothetical protein